MLELSSIQISVLKRFANAGFAVVAFPLYASAAGVRKGNCAALLSPVPDGGMQILGEACYLVDGNLTVRIHRGGRDYFVWKQTQLEATPERLDELTRFRGDLDEVLNRKS
jgi:hypothetical protein